MDPPNTFLVQSHTKCSSPINYLRSVISWNRVHYAGKWYLNRYISLYPHGTEISPKYLVACSSSAVNIKEFCRNVVTIVGYGLLRLSSWVSGALQPAKEQRNLTLLTDGCWAHHRRPVPFSHCSLSGENYFDIVKKCWYISNNDHHVQS